MPVEVSNSQGQQFATAQEAKKATSMAAQMVQWSWYWRLRWLRKLRKSERVTGRHESGRQPFALLMPQMRQQRLPASVRGSLKLCLR